MEFIDLAKQKSRIKSSIQEKINKVIENGQYIMGPEVNEIETNLAKFINAKYCISCASGTNALELVLAAWGIGKGDAVFTTTISFIATAEAIAKTGATPVFVDIDKTTYNLDSNSLEKAIQAVLNNDSSIYPLPAHDNGQKLSPRAIVVVDLFGNPADYNAILSIAQKHSLLVLEDGAQGYGSKYRESFCCNCGCHAATTSFYPAKPLGCYGDGGAVFTNDADLASLVESLRYHGRADAKNKNNNVRIGYNGRLDTIQAAILLAKMEIFADELEKRYQVGKRYGEIIGQAPDIGVPAIDARSKSNWAQYSIMLPATCDRNKLRSDLADKGIPTVINYPIPMPLQKCFAYLGYKEMDFPNVTDVCSRILSLPMHPYLTEKEQDFVVSSLIDAVRRQK